MAALRDIGRKEHVKTILLDILDPKTGETWGSGLPKSESLGRAIFALGVLGEKRAVPRLKQLLNESTGVTKIAVVQALGNLDPDEVEDILYLMLLKLQPHEADWQWILVTALSQSRDRQMYAKMEAYVRGERDPKLRERLEVKLQNMRRNLEIK